MSDAYLTPSIRIRRTPFSSRVERAGVKAYTVYNHMLLPQVFESIEEDYAHLKRSVQLWDVAAERQVEVVGPDASRLVQMTTPRDITGMANDQCVYIPMVDERGRMLNDPVAIKRDSNRYWLSLADTDMLYYCKGLAAGFGLDVEVFEPDVSPLAVQGPKADQLIARVFGEEVAATRFFRYQTVLVEGHEMVIARSGWSHQGGFEIYLDGSDYGEALWDLLFDAGQDLDIRAGCPNTIERIEAGLLSFGSDMTIEHTPFEMGLGKYCDLDTATSCLGHKALLENQKPARQVRPLTIVGAALPPIDYRWNLTNSDGESVGYVSSVAWSPDFVENVAIGMVSQTHWDAGTALEVQTPCLLYTSPSPRDGLLSRMPSYA